MPEPLTRWPSAGELLYLRDEEEARFLGGGEDGLRWPDLAEAEVLVDVLTAERDLERDDEEEEPEEEDPDDEEPDEDDLEEPLEPLQLLPEELLAELEVIGVIVYRLQYIDYIN